MLYQQIFKGMLPLYLAASVLAAPVTETQGSGTPAVSVASTAVPQASNSSSPQAIVAQAQKTYEQNLQALLEGNENCTSQNIAVRKAWDDMEEAERASYVDAVNCLATKPSRTDPNLVPGARNWLDDFAWAHINQTNFIHLSGFLFPWHRQFVWAYEQSLRNECGYTGYLPYWAWERHSDNQTGSPVFQPSRTSFGGNGAYVPHAEQTASIVDVPTPINIPFPAGSGGGYITDGAFANLTINLGPVTPANNTPDNIYGTHYNPRRIKRDFNQTYSANYLTYQTIADLYQTTSIHDFHPLVESVAHRYSHGYVGGEENDLYASPNDPIFFLIHGQIDRLWTVWQGQDFANRLDALDGTLTIQNDPPSENATLSSVMKMGVPAGGDIPISQAMNPVALDYCYMYV